MTAEEWDSLPPIVREAIVKAMPRFHRHEIAEVAWDEEEGRIFVKKKPETKMIKVTVARG